MVDKKETIEILFEAIEEQKYVIESLTSFVEWLACVQTESVFEHPNNVDVETIKRWCVDKLENEIREKQKHIEDRLILLNRLFGKTKENKKDQSNE
jgi:hypothetical protein